MSKLKYLIASLPFIALFAVVKFSQFPEKKVESPLSPNVVGRWLVGKHAQFNDADTLELDTAVKHALNGDTILVRPGNYHLKMKLTKNITIRGLSGNFEDIKIDLKTPISLQGQTLKLENMSILNSFDSDYAFKLNKSNLYMDNVKVKFSGIRKGFIVEAQSAFKSLNNHFIGDNRASSIYLRGASKFYADNNKFIKFKNAIETDHGKFNGELQLQNLEISHCSSSGIYQHGGQLRGQNISISKSASGIIAAGSAITELDQAYIQENEFYGLDVIDGAIVHIDLFQFNKNKVAGIRASGTKSKAELNNGHISSSNLALLAEHQARINGQNLNLADNINIKMKTNNGGEITLGD